MKQEIATIQKVLNSCWIIVDLFSCVIFPPINMANMNNIEHEMIVIVVKYIKVIGKSSISWPLTTGNTSAPIELAIDIVAPTYKKAGNLYCL